MEQGILTAEQYKDLKTKIIHSLERQCRIVPLNSLKHPEYYLKSPIYITLEFFEKEVVASLDDIEAFSHADTEFEAIDQLCEEIVQIYEDITADRENLGPLPRKWLQYLEGLSGCK